MKFKTLIIGIALTTLNSCVSKTDYDKLQEEKYQLELQLEESKKEYNLLYEEKRKTEIEEQRKAEFEKNKIPHISEAQAMKYIKDNYAFYEKDMMYRNVQLRRISDNSFRVSLEECTKKGTFSDDDFFWHSSVRTLTVHKNGKYDF